MPRAQKHPAHLRHSLEKLRLEVAVKRLRFEEAQRAAHKTRPKPKPHDPEIDAIEARNKTVERELRLVRARSTLKFNQDILERGRDRLSAK